MASGDRQRTWFPEMVEVLRADWRSEMSWAEIIALRDQLDDMLNEIRRSRNLQPVMTTTPCPCCNKPMIQGAGGVSVRSTILALNRFGIAPEIEVTFLENAWNKHRRNTGIDLNGRPPHHSGSSGRGNVRQHE